MGPSLLLKPHRMAASSSSSRFCGLSQSFRKQVAVSSVPRPRTYRAPAVPVEMKRVCDLTGKKRHNGFRLSFSHKRNKNLQYPNLQHRKALRTIEKNGLEKMARDAGIDLWKLPFVDMRRERRDYLKEHPMEVPTKKNPGGKKMKNPEKLAASKKAPLVPKYLEGHIVYVREGTDPFSMEEES